MFPDGVWRRAGACSGSHQRPGDATRPNPVRDGIRDRIWFTTLSKADQLGKHGRRDPGSHGILIELLIAS